jgi:excisionase family DNA binding protein
MPNLMTRKQVAEYLKVSYLTVYRWQKEGKLPAVKIGPNAVRYQQADVEKLCAVS